MSPIQVANALLCAFIAADLTHKTLLIMSYCAAQVLRQQKGWDRGRWVGSPQGAVHMVAARLGCKRTMVGTSWVNSRPGCMSRLRKHYPLYSEDSFLAENAS